VRGMPVRDRRYNGRCWGQNRGTTMKGMDKDFLDKLAATFAIEAAEHIQALSSGLLELEKAATREKRTEVLESVFRAAHSLKGAARTGWRRRPRAVPSRRRRRRPGPRGRPPGRRERSAYPRRSSPRSSCRPRSSLR
jgi:hypothetical protein